MIILTGNSLNERHRELNSKVNQAAKDGVPFDDVKSQAEETDVDRIFKIDLASKYKNVDYIMETLKCGDIVYITKAMKCTWLYEDELSNIINPEYLEQNIFPEMSFKMRRTLLKVIAKHVTNSDRAALFYTYCLKIQLPNIALKFLFYTSEAFKLDAITKSSMYISDEDMFHIVGNSFILATAALDQLQQYKIGKYLRNLCYLYSVSEDGYLDLFEKYILKYWSTWRCDERFGKRISKDIALKHKKRILSHTSLYLNMLNMKMTARHSTPDDVKKYVTNLLPIRCSEFWRFYKQYEYMIEVLPIHEGLQFLKETFNKQYPNELFEMNIEFYHAGLYKWMTKVEKESWALKHVEEGLEHFGHGQDFIWYKFVSFEKAFDPIKKFIFVAANADIRTSIVKILVSSAQSDRDLEVLFKYYYQRFVNEMKHNKEMFVDEVLKIHNCFNFDEDCWNAFDKILHSMDVYDDMNAHSCKLEYKLATIIRNIIDDKELHEALKRHIVDGMNLYHFKLQTDKLSADNVEKVYKYIINFYLEKINSFDINNYNDEVEFGVRNHIYNILHVMFYYDKPKEDIPETVMKLIALNMDGYKYNVMFRIEEEPFNQDVLIKELKNDASVALSKMPLFKEELQRSMQCSFTILLRKLRIYFSKDVALKYIQYYEELLALKELREKTSDAAVYGLLHLAENKDRIDFIVKHVPSEPKIDHVNIDRKLLYLRTGICKFMSVSRPIVPLSIVQKYIVGDYLKLCLPTLKSYEANLKPALLIELVKYLLKSPASIQKHGIRMAFQCFSVKVLKEIVSDIWKKTKNVSLRLVMYKTIHDKIAKESDNSSQTELFEAFKAFTLDIREDDDNELFDVMTRSYLPYHILGEHILSAWQVLNTLPQKKIMITRQAAIVRSMADHIGLIQHDVIESIVYEHIRLMLKEEQFKNVSDNECHINELITAKWNLTAKYFMHLPNKEVLEQNLKIVELFIKECVKLWNHTENDVYVMRAFLTRFIKDIGIPIRDTDTTHCLHAIIILKEMLKHLKEALPLVEIYDIICYLRVCIIVGNTFVDGKRVIAERDSEDTTLVFTDIINKFATDFISLLNEFIEGNIYFTSTIYVLKGGLNQFTHKLLFMWPFSVNYNSDYIYFVLCSKLIEMEKAETDKIALELWPASYKEQMCIEFKNKIKSSDNLELKYLLYKNFVSDNNYNSKHF